MTAIPKTRKAIVRLLLSLLLAEAAYIVFALLSGWEARARVGWFIFWTLPWCVVVLCGLYAWRRWKGDDGNALSGCLMTAVICLVPLLLLFQSLVCLVNPSEEVMIYSDGDLQIIEHPGFVTNTGTFSIEEIHGPFRHTLYLGTVYDDGFESLNSRRAIDEFLREKKVQRSR